MKKLLLLSLIAIILSSFTKLNAQTYVSGGIYNNTTWTQANSPYIVQGDITLFPDDTLTIEPGVVIMFEDGFGFDVRGTVEAIGTASDSIIFTSASTNPYTGIWSLINVQTDFHASLNFRYCRVSYSQWGINVLQPDQSPIPVSVFKHCLFYKNTWGIFNYGADTVTVIIDSSAFVSNFTGGYQLGYHTVLSNSLFQNNQYGLWENGGCQITNCTFCGNFRATQTSSMTLIDCSIVNNNIGINQNADNLTCTLINCVIADNDTGLVLRSGSYTNDSFSNLTICGNHIYNVVHSGVYNFDLSNICWCETDSAAIAATIYDGYDNATYGLINFTPFNSCSIDVSGCSAVVGIHEVKASNDDNVEIYPNPFHDMSYMKIKGILLNEHYKVVIFDCYGRVIRTIQVTNPERIEIARNGLASGMYAYQLISPEKKVYAGKFIVE